MRIAVAVAVVVVGAVLVGWTHGANAAEARRQRSERCLEICNYTFEQCQKDLGPKSNSRCDIDVVRCKNACPFETVEEPAVPTAVSHQRCLAACRATYDKCLGKAANKRGGNCAADDVRCEQACPKPPEAAVADSPGAPGAPATAGAAAPAKKAKRGSRVEGAAAPAPLGPTPVPVPEARPVPAAERPLPAAERPAAASAPARGEAVPPAAAAPAGAATAPAAAAAPPSAAARPAPEKRGFFATLGCFFVACEPAGSTPCLLQCNDAYDQCIVRESKRGGECNTRLMNCRKACSEAAPAQ